MRTSTGSISVMKISQKAGHPEGKLEVHTAQAERIEMAILPTAITEAMTKLLSSIPLTGSRVVPLVPTKSVL